LPCGTVYHSISLLANYFRFLFAFEVTFLLFVIRNFCVVHAKWHCHLRTCSSFLLTYFTYLLTPWSSPNGRRRKRQRHVVSHTRWHGPVFYVFQKFLPGRKNFLNKIGSFWTKIFFKSGEGRAPCPDPSPGERGLGLSFPHTSPAPRHRSLEHAQILNTPLVCSHPIKSGMTVFAPVASVPRVTRFVVFGAVYL